MHTLRYRQIHLDFHTSPQIEGIGEAFDKQQYQETLRVGCVDSVTTFAKCHHGWSYHPTEVGRMHPHLKFDLLGAQFEACKEIDVNVPIYISAGVDNVASHDHPEWREVGPDGRYNGWSSSNLAAGFHKMCFNSPYMDYLGEQIREVVRLFPGCDGIFLDIISQGQCCCRWCLEAMANEGLDAETEGDRKQCAQIGLERYYRESTAACRCDNPEMPVFHNSGHIPRGRRDILRHFSHLELESLPTGGWGYDHFPVSAKYCRQLDLDFMGMTGKFHTTWGEFGGFKHPNALRYECAAMLAHGAKCSVGDQLHPDGQADPSTYAVIGEAYKEVREKAPWCVGADNVADVGLLSVQALAPGAGRDDAPDNGAARVLLETHFLFDVLDSEMDFSPYKTLVLPDTVAVTPALKTKLDAYLAQGGKLLLTGGSGLLEDGGGFALDIGAEHCGESEFLPDFVLPHEGVRPDFVDSPLVMYMKSQRIKVTEGESLGDVYDPYFNRNFRHFCSHQHAPARPEASGYDCGVLHGAILYLAHPVFSIYRGFGAVAYKQYIENALTLLLGEDATLETNLPSISRVSMTRQADESRCVIHLLHANTINRGGALNLAGGTVAGRQGSFEVIDELLPVRDVAVAVRIPQTVKRVTLAPQGLEIPFEEADGVTRLHVDSFTCHQMVVLHY